MMMKNFIKPAKSRNDGTELDVVLPLDWKSWNEDPNAPNGTDLFIGITSNLLKWSQFKDTQGEADNKNKMDPLQNKSASSDEPIKSQQYGTQISFYIPGWPPCHSIPNGHFQSWTDSCETWGMGMILMEWHEQEEHDPNPSQIPNWLDYSGGIWKSLVMRQQIGYST